MSAARYAPVPAPLRLIAYVVVDKSKSPAAPVTIKLSRQACRDFVEAQPNAVELRIRRAKVTLFET
jgi:hypothetical protein